MTIQVSQKDRFFVPDGPKKGKNINKNTSGKEYSEKGKKKSGHL